MLEELILKKNTVFVIGAGASKEVNIPTGDDLKQIIIRLLDIQQIVIDQLSGDSIISAALNEHVKKADGWVGDRIKPYLEAAWHIRDALPQAISIDNFIDAHKNDDKIALCGKLAIVRSILQSERHSLLFFNKHKSKNIDYSALEKTWFIPFNQLLTENCCKDVIKERLKSLTFIIFNYDRCFEHFMYYALQNYYKISEDEASSIINDTNIYHPYGCVSTLPWQDSDGSIEFGADPNAKQLLQCATKIKTFTEGTDQSSSEILSIRMHMSSAERLVFMGFAFHKLNMQLIKPERDKDHHPQRCYATTFGISQNDKEIIENELLYSLYDYPLNTSMADLRCKDFFYEFWRGLSF